jgi:hypothetical protein
MPRYRHLPTRQIRPNAVYGELLGKGLIYSVGYDYMMLRYLGIGACFSYLKPATFISPYVSFYPVGGRYSALFFQGGVQVVHINEPPTSLLPDLIWDENTKRGFHLGGQLSIGYEYRSGFLFRVALMAWFDKEDVMPWPGVTLGGSF